MLRQKQKQMDDAEVDQRIAELLERRARLREPQRRWLLNRLADRDLPLASHDDDEIAEVARNAADGIRISEFPVTMAAAQAAREIGVEVIAGAPTSSAAAATPARGGLALSAPGRSTRWPATMSRRRWSRRLAVAAAADGISLAAAVATATTPRPHGAAHRSRGSRPGCGRPGAVRHGRAAGGRGLARRASGRPRWPAAIGAPAPEAGLALSWVPAGDDPLHRLGSAWPGGRESGAPVRSRRCPA